MHMVQSLGGSFLFIRDSMKKQAGCIHLVELTPSTNTQRKLSNAQTVSITNMETKS